MFDWKLTSRRGAERISEISGAIDGLIITGQSGLVTGTHVASNLGWRPVESLCLGDRVLTFDNGMCPIIDIQRETLWTTGMALPEAFKPVLVPQGALSNRTELWLMPEQGLLIESDAASDALGDPFAVVPAASLTGYHGIRRQMPPRRLEMTVLSFATDEVIYVEGGMLAHCPRPRGILTDDPVARDSLYDVLSGGEAKFLVECLLQSEDTRAFRHDPEEVALPG